MEKRKTYSKEFKEEATQVRKSKLGRQSKKPPVSGPTNLPAGKTVYSL